MNKVLCIQISTQLINGKPDNKNIATQYYNTLYNSKHKDGYYRGSHFWELPQWITEIDHNTPVDFYVCENIADTIGHIILNDYTYVCFSVLDVNKHIVKEIMTEYINNYEYTEGHSFFILGGYIELDVYFSDLIQYCDTFKTIKQFIEYMGIEYKQGYSYRLFKDFKTIPRLTLSTGCTNNCDFCTVDKQVKRTLFTTVQQQVNAFKPLKFKLVYINDKTFGQCSNYKTLPMIYKKIKEYNPQFEGFIIQTTTTQFNKLDYVFLIDSHIKYVELGIESFNNDILKRYHKPSTEETTIKSCKLIKALQQFGNDIQLIPNIICGMPEETISTYLNTMNFIKDNKDIISHLNIYSLAVYDNTPLSKRIKIKDSDSNENTLNKSFLHGDQHKQFFNAIHQLGINILISRM